MFAPFANGLNAITLGLAGLGVSIGALCFVILAFMNAGVIFDMRLGGQVKAGFFRIAISIMALGLGAGLITVAQAIAAAAGGGG